MSCNHLNTKSISYRNSTNQKLGVKYGESFNVTLTAEYVLNFQIISLWLLQLFLVFYSELCEASWLLIKITVQYITGTHDFILIETNNNEILLFASIFTFNTFGCILLLCAALWNLRGVFFLNIVKVLEVSDKAKTHVFFQLIENLNNFSVEYPTT